MRISCLRRRAGREVTRTILRVCDMPKTKNRYQNIDERSWGSLEAHDKAQRDLNVKGWKKNSEMLPDNAFADDVPDDLDRDGYIPRSVTHVASKSVLEE